MVNEKIGEVSQSEAKSYVCWLLYAATHRWQALQQWREWRRTVCMCACVCGLPCDRRHPRTDEATAVSKHLPVCPHGEGRIAPADVAGRKT